MRYGRQSLTQPKLRGVLFAGLRPTGFALNINCMKALVITGHTEGGSSHSGERGHVNTRLLEQEPAVGLQIAFSLIPFHRVPAAAFAEYPVNRQITVGLGAGPAPFQSIFVQDSPSRTVELVISAGS